MTEKESPEKTIRNIRRQNRKKYSAEEKTRIVLAELRGDESILVSILYTGEAFGNLSVLVSG